MTTSKGSKQFLILTVLFVTVFAGAAATEKKADIRIISFSKGKWDQSKWFPVRQPNQQKPRLFLYHADSIGTTLESFEKDDYNQEKDNAILVTDTGLTEGQIELTFKAGAGFRKGSYSCPGIAISPVIVDGIAIKMIGVFVASYGVVPWMYTAGTQKQPCRYIAMAAICRSIDMTKKHLLRCRFSKKRKAIALQIDDSDVLVFKYLGNPKIGRFNLEVNSKIGIWGCHGVCDFYEMKILTEPTLPFDRPLKKKK